MLSKNVRLEDTLLGGIAGWIPSNRQADGLNQVHRANTTEVRPIFDLRLGPMAMVKLANFRVLLLPRVDWSEPGLG